MLGIREPEIYGKCGYDALVERVRLHCEKNGVNPVFYQSNHEGDLVDKIQEAYFKGADGIVINPGAYTHTSIALLDAVKATSLPCVEVHISNLAQREDFRQISYIRLASVKTITGHGLDGYIEGCDFLFENFGEKNK